MRKFLIALTVFMSIRAVVFCQEKAVYYANKNDNLYRDYNSKFETERTGEVQRGEILFIADGMIGLVQNNRNYITSFNQNRVKVRTENNRIGWLFTDSVSIADSEILPVEITNNIWTHSYYLDVLRSRSRETLLFHEPFWRDYYHKYEYLFNEFDPRKKEWNDIAVCSSFEFANIYSEMELLRYNSYTFIFEGILSDGENYNISAFCTRRNITFNEADVGLEFILNKKYIITLTLDGDYLDVYIDGRKTFTLFKHSEEIFNQFYRGLMLKNSCDLSRITWPRRADGSMDYPPPSPAPVVAQEIQQPVDTSEIVVSEIITESQSGTEKSPVPLWVWFAIGGAAAAGGAVFVIKRKFSD
jgi:hypothetical protein